MPLHELLATAVRCAVVLPFASAALAEQVAASSERVTVENREMGWGAEGGASSGYVWRGLVISDAPVTEASAWIYARSAPSTS